MKYLPATSDRAETDCQSSGDIFFFFYIYIKAAEVISQWGNTWTWIVSFWRFWTAVMASVTAGETTQGGHRVNDLPCWPLSHDVLLKTCFFSGSDKYFSWRIILHNVE